jgi:predicted kinase
MTPPVDIIVVRGAPGVGKSEVAGHLAMQFPAGAKVEVDALRKMVISVNWTNQKEHIDLLQVAARVAGDFLGIGFRPVIVVDTLSGDKVFGFLKTLQEFRPGAAVALFGLYADEGVLRSRLAGRPDGLFKNFKIARKLNADLLEIGDKHEKRIDTSRLTSAEVAAIIANQVKG